MSSEEPDENTSFIRQRRDLFVISALLIIIQTAQIKIQQLSAMGMTVHVAKPEVLINALWVLWIYWAIRCYQAYNDLEIKYISNAYEKSLTKFCYPFFRITASKQTLEIAKKSELIDKEDKQKLIPLEPTVMNTEIGLWKISYRWHAIVLIENKHPPIEFNNLNMSIKGLDNLKIHAQGLFDFVFKGITFTEYIFPFVFALMPIMYWLWVNIKI